MPEEDIERLLQKARIRNKCFREGDIVSVSQVMYDFERVGNVAEEDHYREHSDIDGLMSTPGTLKVLWISKGYAHGVSFEYKGDQYTDMVLVLWVSKEQVLPTVTFRDKEYEIKIDYYRRYKSVKIKLVEKDGDDYLRVTSFPGEGSMSIGSDSDSYYVLISTFDEVLTALTAAGIVRKIKDTTDRVEHPGLPIQLCILLVNPNDFYDSKAWDNEELRLADDYDY